MDPGHHPGQQHHGPAAGATDAVLTDAGETGPDDEVGAVERGEQVRDRRRRMLAVGVALHDGLHVLALGHEQPCAQRATHAQVEGQADQAHAGAAGHAGGVVGRAVVHDEHLDVRQGLADAGQHAGQGLLLVVRGEHEQHISHAVRCHYVHLGLGSCRRSETTSSAAEACALSPPCRRRARWAVRRRPSGGRPPRSGAAAPRW